MENPARSKTLPWLAVLAAAAVLVAAVLWSMSGGEPPPPPPPEQTRAPPPSTAPRIDAPREPQTAPPVLAQGPADSGVPPEPVLEAPPQEHPVNLAKLREQLPGNLYWEEGVPTQDPEVLRRRTDTARKWNALFGKVQSGTATEEEIHQYYDYRRQLSEDYVAFASLVLQQHGAQLPEQEQGLYELSIRMHRTRLEELPRQVDEALARKKLQDERREAWRRDGQGP